VDETSFRIGDGRLRALYRPRFLPAPELLEDAVALGLGPVEAAVEPARGRLVLTGTDDDVAAAREALLFLDAPRPEALVKVAVVETVRRERAQGGGASLFDRTEGDGFFRGVRTTFEPEDWLRAELLGGLFRGTSVGFEGGHEGLDGTFASVLRGLAEGSEASFLAEPSLVCTEGVPAVVESSVLLPVPTFRREAGTVTVGVVHEPAGVRLEVLAERVGADSVTLRVRPSVKQVSAFETPEGAVATPVFAVREADLRVTVGDGETVVVGGLDHVRRRRARDSVPGLPPPWGLDGVLSSSAREGELSEVLFVVSVRVLVPGRDPAGTLPPGEAERLLHRGSRARVVPR
jgi:type II secretory pathway component GspD/PulD (secretin)